MKYRPNFRQNQRRRPLCKFACSGCFLI